MPEGAVSHTGECDQQKTCSEQGTGEGQRTNTTQDCMKMCQPKVLHAFLQKQPHVHVFCHLGASCARCVRQCSLSEGEEQVVELARMSGSLCLLKTEDPCAAPQTAPDWKRSVP